MENRQEWNSGYSVKRRGRHGNVLLFNDQSKMVQAILKGEIHTIKHLIANGEDVNKTDFEGRSYLHLASFINAGEIAKILISAGARVNCKDNERLTPLHRACRMNLDGIVTILLEKGADVNCKDRNFVTPLHVCAANNALECARLFADRVTNIDMSDRSGATALHHAAFNGNCDVIQFLLKNGSSANAFDKMDRRPIHYAATVDNTDAIRLLVNSGGVVDVRDKDMLTPLHIASAKGCLNAIQMLVEIGANINAVDVSGNTPLHWACLHGQDDVIDELITSGASLNAVNHIGFTPLHYAAASTLGTPALEVLMRHKDNLMINVRDKVGRTPLHLAAKFGRVNRVLDLIRYGANINDTDKKMMTALHYAARGGHSPVIETLIAQSNIEINILDMSGMTPLHHVAFSGVSDACQRLLKSSKSANISIVDASRRTPHFFAALSGNLDSLQLLQPLPSTFDTLNRSLLHYAAAGANFECLNYLLNSDLKLDVNQRDIYGRTPMLYAAAADDDGRCVEVLINAGARIDIPDNDGYYSLNYAAASGKSFVLEMLYKVDYVANIWSKVKFKLCPSYCAAFYGRLECIEFLLSKGVVENIGKCMEYATVKNNMSCLQKIISHDSISPAIFCNAIHLAALKSHMECLCCILNHIEDVDIVDDQMRTPLMMAALNCQNNYDCIDMLLQNNCNVNAIDKNGRNVLFYACFSGHDNSVRGFLDRGANLMQRDVNGKTVFHLAASLGHSDVLFTLINSLSSMKSLGIFHESLVDRDRFTSLHWACLKSQHNSVTILLENMKLKTFYGSTVSPLHIAALVGSDKCMELLISHYGQGIVHLRDSKGRTALHYVSMSKKECKECLNILISNEVEMNACDEDKQTALMYAIRRSYSITALLLLSKGADPCIEDRNGNNALHYACIYKSEEVGIKILEKYPSLVNSTNCDLKTPLHISAANGLFNLTQKLLFAGAEVTASDIENQTPSLCCAKNSDVAECLMIIETVMIFEEVNKKMSLDGPEASAFSSPVNAVRESRSSFLKRASAQLFASTSYESARSSIDAVEDRGSNVSSLTINVASLNSNNDRAVDKEHSSSDSDFY